jgi:integrase
MKGICFSCTAPRCVKGRKPNLQRSAWPDYQGDSLNVSRSIWKTFINRPKTRASPQAVPVIRQLAEILNEYRISMGNPKNGVMFHSGPGEHLDFDRLGQRVVRPAVESLRLAWVQNGGIASILYELGANDKIVQRILRHAKPHVTRERYIKAFDPVVLAAMKQMEAALEVSKRLPTAYQVN